MRKYTAEDIRGLFQPEHEITNAKDELLGPFMEAAYKCFRESHPSVKEGTIRYGPGSTVEITLEEPDVEQFERYVKKNIDIIKEMAAEIIRERQNISFTAIPGAMDIYGVSPKLQGLPE